MSAPDFGDLAALERPTFGTVPGRIDHVCPARWSLPCTHPGPHARPAEPDPATVPAFPELEPTPALWSFTPEPAQDPPGAPAPAADALEAPEPCPLTAHSDSEHRGCHLLRPEPDPYTIAAALAAGRALNAEPCAVRWSATEDGPLTACTLPAGHAGRHETHTRRETRS